MTWSDSFANIAKPNPIAEYLVNRSMRVTGEDVQLRMLWRGK